ncbi:hypothetical protein ACLOJK_029873 [Asimina triloba]
MPELLKLISGKLSIIVSDESISWKKLSNVKSLLEVTRVSTSIKSIPESTRIKDDRPDDGAQ